MRLLPLVLTLPLIALCACGERREWEVVPPEEVNVIQPDDVPEAGEFIRYSPASARGGGLDIAITTYANPSGGPKVDLVGVVHIADEGYFQKLQDYLATCDIVLYEGVKPEDADAEAFQNGLDSEVEARRFQAKMAGWFGFKFQLDAIDYTRENFVHADMSLEQFADAGGGRFINLETNPSESWDGRGELTGALKSMLRQFEGFMDQTMSKPNVLRSLARREFARVLGTTDIEGALDMFPEMSELILDKRNEVVMKRFDEVRDQTNGRIAIFYGAAHMPDLEKQLTRDYGYERKSGQWLRAWALRAPLRRR